MHTLDTYDLVVNFLVIVMMPLIIWANLRNSAIKSPLHVYLWREQPNLMRVALLILAMVTLFSASALLANFGFISPEVEETMDMVIGIPFVIVAVAVIGLAAMAAFKALPDWRGGSMGT